MKLRLSKGVRDISPEQKIVKQNIISVLKENFELYGFVPLETPIIERQSVLKSKYAGGEEILKEMFTMQDQGKRKLGLRYDLTVPFSRYIGMNPQTKIPFKRYQIGRVFRDGPIKLGRYREFWQCDVDIMGCKSVDAEAELLSLAYKTLKKLKLKSVIRVNSRKVLNSILDFAGVAKKRAETTILTIDKLEKIGLEGVEKELVKKGVKKKSIEKIKKCITISGGNNNKIFRLQNILTSEEGAQGLKDLRNLLDLLKTYKTSIVIDPSLARGLSYYTGVVFEIFLLDSNIKSAIAAGGRYDNMISDLLKTEKEYPAVGISFGLDVIAEAIEKQENKTTAKVYVIPIGVKKEAIKIAEKLRKKGINTSIDLMERGISKNLKYANSLNIPFVLLVGEDEIKKKKFKLKNMETGEEKLLELKQIVKELK